LTLHRCRLRYRTFVDRSPPEIHTHAIRHRLRRADRQVLAANPHRSAAAILARRGDGKDTGCAPGYLGSFCADENSRSFQSPCLSWANEQARLRESGIAGWPSTEANCQMAFLHQC